MDGWQVQLRQRQRQQAQLPRCKRCQFVVNQMLEASPSCRRDAAAGKVPRMPAGGLEKLLNLCCMRLNSSVPFPSLSPLQAPTRVLCSVINLCPKCCKIYVFNLAASCLRRVLGAFNSFARLFCCCSSRECPD